MKLTSSNIVTLTASSRQESPIPAVPIRSLVPAPCVTSTASPPIAMRKETSAAASARPARFGQRPQPGKAMAAATSSGSGVANGSRYSDNVGLRGIIVASQYQARFAEENALFIRYRSLISNDASLE